LLETHVGIKARIEPPDGWRDPLADSPNLAAEISQPPTTHRSSVP
jgi:hypothetical protein